MQDSQNDCNVAMMCLFDHTNLDSIANSPSEIAECDHFARCDFDRYRFSVSFMMDSRCQKKIQGNLCGKKFDSDQIRVVLSMSDSPDLRPRLVRVDFVSDDEEFLGFPQASGGLESDFSLPKLSVRPKFIGGSVSPILRSVQCTRRATDQFTRVPIEITCKAAVGELKKRPQKATTSISVAISPAQAEQGLFLCYNRNDSAFVEELKEQLELQGTQVWFDRMIKLGDVWEDVLVEKIPLSSGALVLVGEKGISEVMKQEISVSKKAAASRQFPIIPIIIPGGSKKLLDDALYLGNRNYLDLREGLTPEKLVRLRNDLSDD